MADQDRRQRPAPYSGVTLTLLAIGTILAVPATIDHWNDHTWRGPLLAGSWVALAAVWYDAWQSRRRRG
jgi:hypothetical protein